MSVSNTIKKLSSNCCTGCTSCMNICPVSAISMQENEEGFLYPVINDDMCTKCGLCAKACPAINPEHKNDTNPICYAVMASDDVRSKSSSGGVFPILANYIIENGGYVVGAVWGEGAIVKHIVSNDKDDIEKMCGSKYVQSEIGNCLKEVKELLDNNKKVLFTGTPCQIAGLKGFLKKEYENLYTVDLLCHGTPSPMVFRKYLEQELTQDEQFVSTNFRDKLKGWTSNHITTITTTRKFSYSAKDDDFMNAFLKNFCLRESCNDCQFNKMPRQADISMGDFWGINKYSRKLNDKKGTSLILVNNLKGERLFRGIVDKFKISKEVPLKYAIKGNPVLIKPCQAHENKKGFYEDLKTNSLKYALKNNLKTRYDGVIFNFWYSKNYGALLTAYCIQQYLKEYGKDFRLVDWMPKKWAKVYSGSFCEKFAKEHLLLTENFENIEALKNLNIYTENFIVGSDQVFRYKYIEDSLDAYLLRFTEFNKKRIALSASFGIDDFEAEQKESYFVQKALKRFDAISTREESGVDVCREKFGIAAEHILDPVFLVNTETIENLIDKDMQKYKGKIVTYVLDESDNINKNIEMLAKNKKKDVLSIIGKNIPLQEWLSAIYNSEYFITDSFHGACCAILFKKKFICLTNKERGISRFESLQKTFAIDKNFVSDIADINKEGLLEQDLDWDSVSREIQEHRRKAEKWLKAILEDKVEKTQQDIAAELDFIKNSLNNSVNDKKMQIFDKIFSISKNSTHKIIKIFGLKIKIKRSL